MKTTNRFALLLLSAMLGLSACAVPDEPPAAAPIAVDSASMAVAGEWVSLFDGSTLEGWRGLGRDGIPEGHWTVEDGAIKKIASGEVPSAADGQPLEGGDLMTIATFRDFEFAWEWKVSPAGNSGIKYNVSEEMSTSHEPRYAALGFEYQMLDDEQHPDAELPSHQAGALYDLIPANEARVLRPVGEWNESRIVFRGNHGEHWLNGQKIVEYDLETPRMDSLVAASKYAGVEGFADRREGHIVLQDHKDAVWFRNLRVRTFGEPQ